MSGVDDDVSGAAGADDSSAGVLPIEHADSRNALARVRVSAAVTFFLVLNIINPLTLAGAWQARVPDGCLGGQANLWSEHIESRDRADFALFPRLSAIAERLWVGGEPGDFDDFESRLPVQLRRLASWGVTYRPLDGPRPEQRLPGVPGSPRTLAEREAVVAELVADLRP